MADLILGIETSCDETSAAVLRMDGGRAAIAGLVILSQDVHRIFGGVVPELASRAHVRAIGAVVDQALADAETGLGDLAGIAVTAGPGLIGALLVGVSYAKALAWRLGIPLIGVHHHEGHLFAPTLEDPEVQPPFVALLVSGGHTVLLDVPAWGDYRILGRTRDDAAGEAFDKVGTLLGLGYPAGAEIEQLALFGDPSRFRFPRPMLKELAEDRPDRFSFSFSGLKTALLRASRDSPDLTRDRADLARGFQDAAIEVLAAKTAAAAELLGYPLVVLAGGVACNRALAAAVRARLPEATSLAVASPRLNTDNAAMIAAAGAWHLSQGARSGWDLEAFDTGELGLETATTPPFRRRGG